MTTAFQVQLMSLLVTGGRAGSKGWLMQQADRTHAWNEKSQHMESLIELELNMGLAKGQNENRIT